MGLLVLAIWAILTAGNSLNWWTINGTFLAVLLFIAGLLIVLEYLTGLSLPRPNFRRNGQV